MNLICLSRSRVWLSQATTVLTVFRKPTILLATLRRLPETMNGTHRRQALTSAADAQLCSKRQIEGPPSPWFWKTLKIWTVVCFFTEHQLGQRKRQRKIILPKPFWKPLSFSHNCFNSVLNWIDGIMTFHQSQLSFTTTKELRWLCRRTTTTMLMDFENFYNNPVN